VPTRFFFDVETVGSLEPDQIVLKGIRTLQEKVAGVIQELSGESHMDGVDFGAQSPQMNGAGYGGQDGGYTTPFGGGNSVYAGAGGTTPFGATPYGGANW